jgi:hypothetical protein
VERVIKLTTANKREEYVMVGIRKTIQKRGAKRKGEVRRETVVV